MEKPRKKRLPGWLPVLLALGALGVLCVLLSAPEADGNIFPVQINEILASNTRYPNEEGLCCDYIELFNRGDFPADLGGFQLGDIEGESRYRFPRDTVLEPGAYLVIWLSREAEGPFYGSFGISRAGGEEYYLIGSNRAAVDQVRTLPTDPDEAMIRLEDGTWALSPAPTPGGPNRLTPAAGGITNPLVSPVEISEFSAAETEYYAPGGFYCDWVELHNRSQEAAELSGFTLSDNVGNEKYVFPPDTVLKAGGYLLILCSDRGTGPDMAPFSLSRQGGEELVLKDPRGRIADLELCPAMDSGSLARRGEAWVHTEESTPGYENTPRGREAFREALGGEQGTVVISEVMAGPQLLVPDSSGRFPDWVELWNRGDRAVDLTGWYLSDREEEPLRWQFPPLLLKPGQRQLLFCAREGGEEALRADFSLPAGGGTLILSARPGMEVHRVTYGTCPANRAYTFDTGEAVLTEEPTPGYASTREGREAFLETCLPRGPLAIWELMTYNDWYLPQDLGECRDWAELRNISDAPVDLGDYSLTDDPEDPRRFPLPRQILEPGELFVVILSGDETCSGPHVHGNFSLNARSDRLLLYGPGEVPVDFTAPEQIPWKRSWGRQEGRGGFFLMEPTPGRENAPGLSLQSPPPQSDYPPGIHRSTEPFRVHLRGEGTIHYTLDGSVPGEEDPVYTEPLEIGETAVLRAAVLEPGREPGELYTATFLLNDTHSLPVISLVTDPEGLWGYGGIYKNGDLSRKEIRLPANVAFTGPEGGFSRNCDLSLHGATTVLAFHKKSFTLRFGDVWGGPLQYDVFADGGIRSFRSLIVRTAHESTYSTQMHDAFIGQTAAENSRTLVSQRHRYAALYLNGAYWGLYALRDRHSPELYGALMGVPASTVTVQRYCTQGDNSLRTLYNRCSGGYLATEEGYAWAKTVMDVESVADWIIMEAYMSNADIGGNVRYYHSTADGLWRMGLVDADLGMAGSTATFTMVTETWHHGRLMEAFLQNRDFLELLARRLAELLRGPMSDEAMLARLQQMEDTIRAETVLDSRRWDIPDYGWSTFTALMEDFCRGRAREMVDGLCAYGGFTEEERAEFFGSLPGEGGET